MKFVLSVVLFLWILAAGRADEFFLTNAVTGEKFGPFQFREGERLSLGKQTLIIAKVLTPKQKIEEKLKLTHIPEMDLRQASIDDVVDFLQAASKEFDPADSLSLKQGVQFVLNLPKPSKSRRQKTPTETKS